MIHVSGEPPPGTLRKLVFYPSDLSPQVLEDCLKKETVEDGPIEWVKSSNQDYLSVYEMYVGFPSHLINEMKSPEASEREEIGLFSVVPDGPVWSLPPGEDEIEVPEEDGYALIQAALAHLTGRLSAIAESPAKLVAYFRKADFLPSESLEALVAQVRTLIESKPERRADLSGFLSGLRGKQRLQARKLMAGLL
jgi:hypothetical protein